MSNNFAPPTKLYKNFDTAHIAGILEASSDSFAALNRSWKFTYVNRNFEILRNRTRDELLGRSIWELFPELIGTDTYIYYHQALKTNQPIYFEGFFPEVSAWYSVRANPTEEGLLVFLHDITAFKEAENAIANFALTPDLSVGVEIPAFLKASRHDLQNVVARNMAEGVCLVRADDGQILYANPKFEQMFGYAPGEMDGQNVNIVNYPDETTDSQAVTENIIGQIMREGSASYEVHNVKKDGTLFWCRATASVFQHPDYGQILVAVQQDITEHKQTQQRLAESEDKYRSLVAALDEGVVMQDSNGAIMTCNSSAEQILGLSEAQLAGRTSIDPRWRSIREDGQPFPGNEHPAMQTLQSGQPCHEVVMGVHKPEGELTWISINSQPIFAPDAPNSLPVAVVSSFTDITARKKVENELLQSYSYYRNLVQNLPGTAVLLFDRDLRYLIAEGDALASNGFESQSIEGHTLWEVLEPAAVEQLLPFYQAALNGISHSFEHHFGSLIYLVQAVPIRNNAGEIVAGMLLNQDITAIKRAEMIVAAEKEQLAVTLRSIGDGVITTDLNGTVVLLNRVAEDLTGWRQEEAVGRPLEDIFVIINEATRQPVDNPVKRTLATGEVQELANHTVLISRNGTERNISDSSAPIRDRHSQIIGTVLVFRDTTNEQQLANEFLKNSKLEAIGLLAGGIAHDFNNLLTAIIGNIGLAKLAAADQNQLDDELIEYLEDAEKAALRSKDITQQLLTFAKGGAPIRKPSDLAQVIRESAGFALHGANVRCNFDLQPRLWSVLADIGQISQVVQNLVLNAVEAMPRGGYIEIKAENMTLYDGQIHDLPGGNYLKLSVKDNGLGISNGNLPKIFDPYFSTKQRGSGLGLAVCHSIIQKHDGTITVQSKPSHGTIFSLYLPANYQTGPESSRPAIKLSQGKGRILLMDDEASIRQLTAKVVERLGYQVETASDGPEVVRAYSAAKHGRQPFDLVILDLTVPGGLGGKETMNALLEVDPDVKAVVSSGYSSDPIMANYKDYGFQGVLLKPYRLDELSLVLQKLVVTSS